jgi:hypothetical protein
MSPPSKPKPPALAVTTQGACVVSLRPRTKGTTTGTYGARSDGAGGNLADTGCTFAKAARGTLARALASSYRQPQRVVRLKYTAPSDESFHTWPYSLT